MGIKWDGGKIMAHENSSFPSWCCPTRFCCSCRHGWTPNYFEVVLAGFTDDAANCDAGECVAANGTYYINDTYNCSIQNSPYYRATWSLDISDGCDAAGTCNDCRLLYIWLQIFAPGDGMPFSSYDGGTIRVLLEFTDIQNAIFVKTYADDIFVPCSTLSSVSIPLDSLDAATCNGTPTCTVTAVN